MFSNHLLYFKTKEAEVLSMRLLKHKVIIAAFLNLFIVACLGVLLRTFPFINGFPLSYKNVLHGHSHFAFGGWIMPVLMVLIWMYFPELTSKVNLKNWRNISYLFLFSAYGMLFSFPVQGYELISIIFSSLSVIASFYFAIVCFKALKKLRTTTANKFLKWGLFYLVISAVGPFATGPLIAMGYQGTPAYFNAIYFYLHFQYNGFFLFIVLAIIYKMLDYSALKDNGTVVFKLMNFACIPSFFLSVLWNKPAGVFYFIGGSAAVLQLVAAYFFIKDVKHIVWREEWIKNILSIVIIAFVIKVILQALSALPAIAQLAAEQRNFVIAYLHLVLLGIISLFAFSAIFNKYQITLSMNLRLGLVLYLFSFLTTECLLVLQAVGGIINFSLPDYNFLLLVFSMFFPVSILMIWLSVRERLVVKTLNLAS